MNQRSYKTLEKSVNSLRNDMIDMLQKLVSILSVTGNEGQAQDFMRRNYDALGLDVRVLLCQSGYGLIPSSVLRLRETL